MTFDEPGDSEQRPLLDEEAARIGAALVRQVDEAISFRDAVGRSVTWLLDDGDAARSVGGHVVPAARKGGSASLPSQPGVLTGATAALLIDVLGGALRERSAAGDLQSASRVAEVVIRMSTSWFALRGVMLRDHYIEATVDMAVALASRSVFAPVASQR